MAIPRGIGKGKLISDEQCRILFMKMYGKNGMGRGGSFEKLRKWYTQEYGINEITGKPFSRMAMEMACWRWALKDNFTLTESKQLYRDYVLLWGEYLSDEKWRQTVYLRAKMVHKSGATKFYRNHPEYDLRGTEIEPKAS